MEYSRLSVVNIFQNSFVRKHGFSDSTDGGLIYTYFKHHANQISSYVTDLKPLTVTISMHF